jgi:uncharacterized protein DUF5658
MSIKLANWLVVLTKRLLIALFLIAQLLDGVMTYAGIQHFGLWAEGNPLLSTWMTLVGPQPAIVGAKLMASACGMVLYWYGMRNVLWALTLLYAGAAVGPWFAILHTLR